MQEQNEVEKQVTIYPWSGKNRNVQRLESPDSQMILGGGAPENEENAHRDREENEKTGDDNGFALVLAPNLESGYSNKCLTFQSPTLPPMVGDGSFEIANLEMWTLTPMGDIDQAEKVEFGRRFIFDNSHFLED